MENQKVAPSTFSFKKDGNDEEKLFLM